MRNTKTAKKTASFIVAFAPVKTFILMTLAAILALGFFPGCSISMVREVEEESEASPSDETLNNQELDPTKSSDADDDNSENEGHAEWKQILRDFLANEFPSLYDEATIQKNEQLISQWHDDNNFVPSPSDIPVDAIDAEIAGTPGKWHTDWFYYPMLLPYQGEFYDLDGDGIPEVIVSYPTPWAEGNFKFVYKLCDGRYETIDMGEHLRGGYLVIEYLYQDYQRRTVLVACYPDICPNSIYFLDIRDKKAVYGDYVDSKGNAHSDLFDLDDSQIDEILSELAPLLEFDCSDIDIIDSVSNREIRQHIAQNPLDTEISNWDEIFENFSCIAAIPEKDIYLYTCNGGEGILLDYQGKYEVFDYWALTPRKILPEMFLHDYDGDGREELAINLYQASGTGVSMWSLLMVEVNEEAKRYGDIFYKFDHTMLRFDEISEMITAHIEKTEAYVENGKHLLDIYLDGIKYTIDLLDLKGIYGDEDDEELAERWMSTEICIENINDIVIENAIVIRFPIGQRIAGAGIPYYGEMAICAEINYGSGKFQINKAWISEME